jgi:hypothetical protein
MGSQDHHCLPYSGRRDLHQGFVVETHSTIQSPQPDYSQMADIFFGMTLNMLTNYTQYADQLWDSTNQRRQNEFVVVLQ